MILYNHASAPLRLEWPTDWPSGVTAVTLAIYGKDGTALRTPTASTVPAATTTTAIATAGDTALSVTAVGTFVPGDVIRLVSVAGVYEDVPIQSIVGTMLALGRALRFDYAIGTAVRPRHCTATQATTTVATWTKGLQVSLVWQPNTATPAHTELTEVRSQEFSLAGLRETFAAMYPDEYRSIEARWTVMAGQAELRIKSRLLGWPERYIDTLVEQRALEPVTLDEIRLLSLMAGGSQWSDEIPVARTSLAEQWKVFDERAKWFDTNEDHIEDTDKEIWSGEWRPSGRTW